MDKLAAMRAFVEIADRGSLTAAASALGKAQPTIVRTLANLEQALGVRLMRRTTRRLALTDEGRDYLARARRILADIDDAERDLERGDSAPRGQLRVTAPVTFGQMHVAPAVVEFLAQHPQVRAELLLLDRVVDLLEEGIDLAVRIGPLADSTMIATEIGRMRQVVVASPQLLTRVGEPLHPDALAAQPCIQFVGLGNERKWRFYEQTREIQVAVLAILATNQAIPAVEACAAGLGFGRFLAYQVEPWVKAGRLSVVLQAFEPPPAPVNLVSPDRRLMSSRVRVFREFLRAHLRDVLHRASAKKSGGGIE